MAKPIQQDLFCYKGETYSQNFYFKRNEQPIDLTDCIPKSQIRPAENHKQLIAEFICTIDAVAGKVNLALTSETTAELAPGYYAWDLKMTDGIGVVKYWLRGAFVVSGSVTE